MNASITAATQWHPHWTPWDRIERRAMACTLSILKTNTVAWRSLGVLIERRGDAVRSQRNRSSVGAHKGRCANTVVVCGVCMETARRSLRCHCVLNALSVQRQRSESVAHTLCMMWTRSESTENCHQELRRNAIGTTCELRSNALVAVRTP